MKKSEFINIVSHYLLNDDIQKAVDTIYIITKARKYEIEKICREALVTDSNVGDTVYSHLVNMRRGEYKTRILRFNLTLNFENI